MGRGCVDGDRGDPDRREHVLGEGGGQERVEDGLRNAWQDEKVSDGVDGAWVVDRVRQENVRNDDCQAKPQLANASSPAVIAECV